VPLSVEDVTRAHDFLGRTDEIVDQRRAVYGVAIEILSGAADVGANVLDNPVVRGHVGSVLSGTCAYDPRNLRPVQSLVDDGFAFEVAECAVRLASTPSIRTELAGAVERIADELGRHGDGSGARLLDADADERDLSVAARRIVQGVETAIRVAPALALDLLPHVAVIGVLAADAHHRLGSASAREFPGIVMVPEPETAVEVAEALIHEGAHQKFFDLAVARAMFAPDQSAAPLFAPGWAPPNAPRWPFEQVFAAFHAYCCLSAFARRLSTLPDMDLHPHSLLPRADERASELGRWLHEQGEYLGPDGAALVEQLTDERFRAPMAPAGVRVADIGEEDVVRVCRGRTVIARPGRPLELYWVPGELVAP
jgi:hypothetical protein